VSNDCEVQCNYVDDEKLQELREIVAISGCKEYRYKKVARLKPPK
jgi:hypothetical protein